MRAIQHDARRQHVRRHASSVSILFREVSTDGGWRIDEDFRGDALEELLHAPAERGQMDDVDIEVAARVSFTANDGAGGNDADRVHFGEDEPHGRLQCGRKRVRKWRPSALGQAICRHVAEMSSQSIRQTRSLSRRASSGGIQKD